MTKIGDVLKTAGLALEKIAEAEAAQYIEDHRDALLTAAKTLELDAEREIVTAVQRNLPTGGVWGLGLRASVSKTIEGAGAQIVADLGGAEPAMLAAVQAWLEHQATKPN